MPVHFARNGLPSDGLTRSMKKRPVGFWQRTESSQYPRRPPSFIPAPGFGTYRIKGTQGPVSADYLIYTPLWVGCFPWLFSLLPPARAAGRRSSSPFPEAPKGKRTGRPKEGTKSDRENFPKTSQNGDARGLGRELPGMLVETGRPFLPIARNCYCCRADATGISRMMLIDS